MSKSRQMLSEVTASARTAGVDCDDIVVVGDSPYEEIIDNAEKNHCDLIMMASHARRGLDGMMFGSETVRVLKHTKIPVLVVPGRGASAPSPCSAGRRARRAARTRGRSPRPAARSSRRGPATR